MSSLNHAWVKQITDIFGVIETRDEKKYYDSGPHSSEMERLNKAFGRMHGFSALTNLVGLGVTVWYGFILAKRLQ